MSDAVPPVNRAAFLEEPARYERRAVAFFDVMGWRSKIEDAGSDVERVTRLKNIVRLFSTLDSTYKNSQNPFSVRHSTFSDNVVVSTEASIHSTFTLLIRLALVQFVAAQLGHFIRGGVTVGEIVHDEHVVFGPALNQAYHLESEVAVNPRIVLGPECFEPFGGAGGLGELVAVEDDVHFLNPWTRRFAELYVVIPGAPPSKVPPAGHLLPIIMRKVLEEMGKPIGPRALGQLTWLRDRLTPLFIKDGQFVIDE